MSATPAPTTTKNAAGAHWRGRLVRRWIKPKPPEPPPVWEGKCSCCGGRVIANYIPEKSGSCLACALGVTEASKQRAADRKQIELYKTAMRELEAEKQSPPNVGDLATTPAPSDTQKNH